MWYLFIISIRTTSAFKYVKIKILQINSNNIISLFNIFYYVLGYAKGIPSFKTYWSKEEFEDYICTLFTSTPLNLVGFNTAKVDKKKKLVTVHFGEDLTDFKNVLGTSQLLVIIPQRDLPQPHSPETRDDTTTITSPGRSLPIFIMRFILLMQINFILAHVRTSRGRRHTQREEPPRRSSYGKL